MLIMNEGKTQKDGPKKKETDGDTPRLYSQELTETNYTC